MEPTPEAVDVAELVRQAIRDEEHGRALELVEQTIAGDGITAELDLLRVEAYIGLEQFRVAHDRVRTLLEQGGDEVRGRALLCKARVFRRSSRYLEEAIVAALDAAAHGERARDAELTGEARMEAARVYSRKGARALAEREVERARAALGEDDPRPGYGWSAILMEFDDRPAAKQALEGILDKGRAGRMLGLSGLAHLEFVMGEFDAALRHLDALEPLPQGSLWPRRIRVMVRASQQRWDDAIAALDAVIAASPHADTVWRDRYERALCHYRAGRIDAGRAGWKEVVDLAPEEDYWRSQASRDLARLGHPEAVHRPRRRLKEFPSVSQLRDHCGPASCELYLRYFGLSHDQVAIAREIKTPDGGTPVYRMRRYLEQAGFVTRRLEADLDHLRRFIDAGFPVIMEESYSSSSHVAVAIGYDDAREVLEVQDPMTHRVRETFYEDLTQLRNLSNHGALVAAPRDDAAKLAALDAVASGDCRYIALVDEAWAAQDAGEPEKGDALVDESIALHREYELAWIYRFRRAQSRAGSDPTPDNRVTLHRVLAELTSLWPDDEWPQQMMGQVYYFDDRVQEALAAFERARDRDPNDTYNWSMIGDCHISLGNTRGAYDALTEALARDPAAVRPNENLADLAHQRGERTLAWELNEVALELNRDNYFNHAVHGELLEKDGAREAAIESYERALAIDPLRSWVTVKLAKLLAAVDRVDDAAARMRELIARNPEGVDARIDLADLLFNHGRFAESVAMCEEIQKLAPQVAAGHSIMGAALARMGDVEAGLARLDKALTLRPVYTWVYTQKGKLLREAGRKMEAIQALAGAVGMSGAAARCEYDLGDALVDAGFAGEGVRYLRSAAVHGDLSEAQLARIGELIVDSQSGDADAFFDEVAEHHPGDVGVLRAHARTMLEVLWAPGAGAAVLERIKAIAPEDPYALASDGEDLAAHSLDTEPEAERLMRQALELEPDLVYGRRVFGEFLNERGRFEEAIDVLAPCPPNFRSDKLKLQARLGAADYTGATAVIDGFRARYDKGDDRGYGTLQLDYMVARRRWDWAEALRLAETISRQSHERDDDGRLDRWEEERFECLVRLGELDRALRFGEAQAVDADSLGKLAYSAFRAGQLPLGVGLARRALRLSPDETQAIAVIAHSHEHAGELETCIATWHRLGELDPQWHVWQEQIARVSVGVGDLEVAAEMAEDAVAGGHLCPWSFSTRADVRVLEGDEDGARADLERSWMLVEPALREHDAQEVWALRAALAGRRDDAERLYAAFLADTSHSAVDRERVARVRAHLG